MAVERLSRFPVQGETFSIELPTEPAFVSTARLFASSIARHFGCEEPTVEDVKLAVSEACTAAVMDRGDSAWEESVWLRIVRADARLWFQVCCVEAAWAKGRVGERLPWLTPEEEPVGPVGVELIQLLFEDASTVRDDRGAVRVLFSVGLAPERAP